MSWVPSLHIKKIVILTLLFEKQTNKQTTTTTKIYKKEKKENEKENERKRKIVLTFQKQAQPFSVRFTRHCPHQRAHVILASVNLVPRIFALHVCIACTACSKHDGFLNWFTYQSINMRTCLSPHDLPRSKPASRL